MQHRSDLGLCPGGRPQCQFWRYRAWLLLRCRGCVVQAGAWKEVGSVAEMVTVTVTVAGLGDGVWRGSGWGLGEGRWEVRGVEVAG